MLLSESVAKSSELGKAIQKCLDDPVVHAVICDKQKYTHAQELVILSAFMVYELFEVGTNSFWFSYLASLPKTYNLPVCWPNERVLTLLGNTSLSYLTTGRREWLENVLKCLQEPCSAFFATSKALTYENLLWAYCAITSRAFPKSRPSVQDSDWTNLSEICLFPVLDMINHKPYRKIEWQMSSEGVRFITMEPVAAGDELFNNYGPKGNENLLSNYGFVLENNAEDYYKITLALAKEDPAYEAKQNLLCKLESNATVFLLFADDLELNPYVLGISRVLACNTSDLHFLESLLTTNQNPHLIRVSLRNELTALYSLYSQIELKLKGLRSGYNDVSKVDKTNYLEYMATVYRSGQILVLEKQQQLITDQARLVAPDLNSILFTKLHPNIDPEFLTTLQNFEFDQDIEMCILAILYMKQYPKLSSSERLKLLGEEGILEFLEFYHESIEPIFVDHGDIFPNNLLNSETMANMICVMDMHGSSIPFGWLGSDEYEDGGIFIEPQL
jgi:hypothetical protein